MPLPSLIVEDGTGLSGANSYASRLELYEYSYRFPETYIAAWRQLDDFGVDQLGIWATALLDQWLIFDGVFRLYQGQRLNFPVTGLCDQFGVGLQPHPLPRFLKDATCQMAIELSRGDRTVEPTRGLESATVGPLSVVFDKNSANSARVIPRSVAVIVAPYGGRVRGSRGIRSVPVFRA